MSEGLLEEAATYADWHERNAEDAASETEERFHREASAWIDRVAGSATAAEARAIELQAELAEFESDVAGRFKRLARAFKADAQQFSDENENDLSDYAKHAAARVEDVLDGDTVQSPPAGARKCGCGNRLAYVVGGGSEAALCRECDEAVLSAIVERT